MKFLLIIALILSSKAYAQIDSAATFDRSDGTIFITDSIPTGGVYNMTQLDSTYEFSVGRGWEGYQLHDTPYEVFIGDIKLIKYLKDLEERNKRLEDKLNAIIKLLTDKPKQQ